MWSRSSVSDRRSSFPNCIVCGASFFSFQSDASKGALEERDAVKQQLKKLALELKSFYEVQGLDPHDYRALSPYL